MKEFKVTFLKETLDLMDILVKFSYHPKILTQQAIWGTQTSILNKHHGNSDADVPWNNSSFSDLKGLYRRMSRAVPFSFSLLSYPFLSFMFSHENRTQHLDRPLLFTCFPPKHKQELYFLTHDVFSNIWATYEQEVKGMSSFIILASPFFSKTKVMGKPLQHHTVERYFNKFSTTVIAYIPMTRWLVWVSFFINIAQIRIFFYKLVMGMCNKY